MQDIVLKQRRWLARLQDISPNSRPVLVQRHKKNVWHDWHDDIPLTPYHTRSILPNELVFDPDTPDWNRMRKGMNKIIGFMEEKDIPFMLAYTGGKGCHLHVWFDGTAIGVSEELHRRLEKHKSIDAARTARIALYTYIVQGAGVSEDSIMLDRGKVAWSSMKKGSLVRVIGGQRPGGMFKTQIDRIPLTRPTPGTLPLRFPENIKLWVPGRDALERLYDDLRKQIQLAEQTAGKQRIEQWTYPEGRHPEYINKCSAIRAAERGVREGQRDYVVTGLICAFRRWYRYPVQTALEAIRQWCQACTPPFDEETAEYKLKRIYEQSEDEIYTPCYFMHSAGLCDRRC